MPNPICENCKQREGTTHWLGDSASLAVSHGWVDMYPWWCDLCVTKAQLEYAEQQVQRVAELQAKLKELEDAEVS